MIRINGSRTFISNTATISLLTNKPGDVSFWQKSDREDDVHIIPTSELSNLGQPVKQPFGVRGVGVRRFLDFQRKPCFQCNLEFEDFRRPAELTKVIGCLYRKSIQKNI